MRLEKTPEMLNLARRLVWFARPEQALEQPQILLTQVMNLGTVEDVLIARQAVGLEGFREVLERAHPGTFDPRSWAYWNFLCGRWPAPPLPTRNIPP